MRTIIILLAVWLMWGCQKNEMPPIVLNARMYDVPTYVNLKDSITFTSISTGRIYFTIWDFGDGNSDTGIICKYKYRQPGKYNVRLTIMDYDRAIKSTLEKTVNVGAVFISKVELLSYPNISWRSGQPWKAAPGEVNPYFRIILKDKLYKWVTKVDSKTKIEITRDSLPSTFKSELDIWEVSNKYEYVLGFFNKDTTGGEDEIMAQQVFTNLPGTMNSPIEVKKDSVHFKVYMDIVF